MAREVELGALKERARFLSDTVNDVTITEEALRASANLHVCAVYDKLVAADEDYYAATFQITTTPGVIQYAVPAEFRNLTHVYVRETADERREILPMPAMGRGQFKAPSGSWTLDVEIIPVPNVLEDDGDTFDGVSGWEELIAALMARDIMTSRESDPSVPMAIIAMMEPRITARARARDRGGKRVTDMDEAYGHPYDYYWGRNSKLACYRLRAGNLELYESLWGFR
jgi:hypothetical protein